MHIVVCKDYEEMSRRAAEIVAEQVKKRPDGLISFPGGDTPLGMVHVFADMVNEGKVDISRTHYVSLDEWVGLSNEDEGSCGLFNQQNLLSRLQHPFAGTHRALAVCSISRTCCPAYSIRSRAHTSSTALPRTLSPSASPSTTTFPSTNRSTYPCSASA